jgi:hypothetical protein
VEGDDPMPLLGEHPRHRLGEELLVVDDEILRLRSPSTSRIGGPQHTRIGGEHQAHTRRLPCDRLDLSAMLAEERPADAQREARAGIEHAPDGRVRGLQLVENLRRDPRRVEVERDAAALGIARCSMRNVRRGP